LGLWTLGAEEGKRLPLRIAPQAAAGQGKGFAGGPSWPASKLTRETHLDNIVVSEDSPFLLKRWGEPLLAAHYEELYSRSDPQPCSWSFSGVKITASLPSASFDSPRRFPPCFSDGGGDGSPFQALFPWFGKAGWRRALPPARSVSAQAIIDSVGKTDRHATFFEMLGTSPSRLFQKRGDSLGLGVCCGASAAASANGSGFLFYLGLMTRPLRSGTKMWACPRSAIVRPGQMRTTSWETGSGPAAVAPRFTGSGARVWLRSAGLPAPAVIASVSWSLESGFHSIPSKKATSIYPSRRRALIQVCGLERGCCSAPRANEQHFRGGQHPSHRGRPWVNWLAWACTVRAPR